MDQYILGIETSCDETSIAVVKNGHEVLSNIISSQIEVHKKYGGVVPEVASRKHLENIMPVLDLALKEAGVKKEELSAIGVTNEPGLIGALMVGLTVAKGLSIALGIPLIPVHHLRGHIYANLVENQVEGFPVLALIVSGGHTSLAVWESHDSIKVLGETVDDAAGEAFDKIARKLGLGYPGGPVVEELAKKGDAAKIKFPVADLGKGSFNFSYSGLKSSVINYIHNLEQKGETIVPEDICASFQEAVIESIVARVLKASEATGIKKVVLGGGVTANKTLVGALKERGSRIDLEVYSPSGILCTDNGVTIAMAASFLWQSGKIGDLYTNARSNSKIS